MTAAHDPLDATRAVSSERTDSYDGAYGSAANLPDSNETVGGVGSPGPLTLGASGPAPSPDEASAETSRDVAWSHPSRGITGDLGGPLPELSRASSAACVCGEINTRHCPVHGQGESSAAHIPPRLALYMRLQAELNMLSSVSIEVPALRPAAKALREALGD